MLLTHGRAESWNPISRVPQPWPASCPPTARRGAHCHSPLPSDLHPGWDWPPMVPLILILCVVFLLALLLSEHARRSILQGGFQTVPLSTRTPTIAALSNVLWCPCVMA